MYRRLIIVLLAATIFLTSCNNGDDINLSTGDNSVNLQETSTMESIKEPEEAEEPEEPEEPEEAINWGNPSDRLKKFADHDGRINGYQDYEITLSMVASQKKSKELVLPFENMGSEFLTRIQNRKAIKENVVSLKEADNVILKVTEDNDNYIFIFFEDGDVYTIQGGLTYFLGNDTFVFNTLRMTFVFAAMEQLEKTEIDTADYPQFAPISDNIEFSYSKQDLPNVTKYTADTYNLAIEYSGHAVPIPIQDENLKSAIFQNINKEFSIAQEEIMLGDTSTIIRVFNNDNCYSYELMGQTLFDYNNKVALLLPDEELSEAVKCAVQYELMRLLD